MPALITPRYRPSVERQTKLYWSLRRTSAVCAAARAKAGPRTARKIPSNSEPWLPHPARNLAELLWVMSEMEKHASAWRIELKTL